MLNFLTQINLTDTTQNLPTIPEPVEQELSIWELVVSGGMGGMVIMAILAVLSIFAVYIFVERLLAISKSSKENPNFMDQIKDYIHDGKIDSAKNLCRSVDTPVARMIEKGVSRIGKPLNDIAAAVENTGKLELNKLEKNLATLATIAGAAPMIGFLGTVIGMILAVHKLATAGGNVDVQMLSEGIYTAMVTTVGGLVVGIMAYVGYNMLVAKVSKVVNQMEAKTTEFLDILNEPVK